MAYSCDGGCPRIQRFSSNDPLVHHLGRQTGDALHDNARQINEVRYTVANFRRSSVPAPLSDPSPAPVTSLPTKWPTRAPFPSPVTPPGVKSCAHNEHKVSFEVRIETIGTQGIHSQFLSWSLVDERNLDRVIAASTDFQPSEVPSKCIWSGACYAFHIRNTSTPSFGNFAYRPSIFADGKLVGGGNIIMPGASSSHRFSIDSTKNRFFVNKKKSRKRKCRWLRKTANRARRRCLKIGDVRNVCPETCANFGSCQFGS